MLNPYQADISLLRVTSPYGNRVLFGKNEFHKGIDLVSEGVKTVVSIGDGIVASSTIVIDKSNATWQWGNYIRIDLDTGERVYYCHLSKRLVTAGQKVSRGEVIGIEGSTGYSTGSHLHLEIRPRGTSGESIDASEFIGIENKVGKVIDTEKKEEVQEMTKSEIEKIIEGKLNEIEAEKALLESADWAVEPLKTLVKNGVLIGDENGNLMPKCNITREQLAIILARFKYNFYTELRNEIKGLINEALNG
jgi:murein DD-endopeptidase MepM/ murein hydrolase activator NlpD